MNEGYMDINMYSLTDINMNTNEDIIQELYCLEMHLSPKIHIYWYMHFATRWLTSNCLNIKVRKVNNSKIHKNTSYYKEFTTTNFIEFTHVMKFNFYYTKGVLKIIPNALLSTCNITVRIKLFVQWMLTS